MWSRFGIVSLALGLGAAPIASSHAADAANGGALARQWCAGCHAVAADAAVRSDTPPSFVSIARRPGPSEDSLRAWLGAPHPSMPDFDLSRAALADLTAYILSLKGADRN
jgi:mono/diheme cytochrome c family protein